MKFCLAVFEHETLMNYCRVAEDCHLAPKAIKMVIMVI